MEKTVSILDRNGKQVKYDIVEVHIVIDARRHQCCALCIRCDKAVAGSERRSNPAPISHTHALSLLHDEQTTIPFQTCQGRVSAFK
jgi:hypothetical protein